jgi:hypothetical protein
LPHEDAGRAGLRSGAAIAADPKPMASKALERRWNALYERKPIAKSEFVK